MYTMIICALIGLLISLQNKEKDKELKIFSLIIFTVFGAVGGIILSFFIPTQMKEEVFSKYEILCLQDNNNISGRFFLGSGSINGEMKYTFYYNDHGNIKLKSIPTYNTIINYSDQPSITTYGYTKTDDIINNFGLPLLDKNWENVRYLIEVPKGTIKTEYNLDAK